MSQQTIIIPNRKKGKPLFSPESQVRGLHKNFANLKKRVRSNQFYVLEMTGAEQQPATSTVRSGWEGVGRDPAVPSPSFVTEIMAVPVPTSVSSASSGSFGTQQEQVIIPLDPHSSHLPQSLCRLSWLKSWGYTANLF